MKISILGTGAFGMALASIFYNNKCNIKMWTNSEDEKDMLIKNRKSDKINYNIPSDIIISTDMKEVVLNTDITVVAIPAKFVGSTSKELNKYFKSNQVICIASKGIEQNSCLFLYDIIRNNIDTLNIGVISGGTFAEDIINNVRNRVTAYEDSVRHSYEMYKLALYKDSIANHLLHESKIIRRNYNFAK